MATLNPTHKRSASPSQGIGGEAAARVAGRNPIPYPAFFPVAENAFFPTYPTYFTPSTPVHTSIIKPFSKTYPFG